MRGVRDRFSFLWRKNGSLSWVWHFIKYRSSMNRQEVLGRIKERLSGIAELAVASSFATNLELTHSLCPKGPGSGFLRVLRGVRPDEIMAIGRQRE